MERYTWARGRPALPTVAPWQCSDCCRPPPECCENPVPLICGRIACRHASLRTRAAARLVTEGSLVRMHASAIVVFTGFERADAEVVAAEVALEDLIEG